MDEYIEQLLAEMPAPAVLQDVVRNILDAPISEAVKKRLLKPLLPEAYRPTPPPRKARERKRKAIIKEFDPVVKQPKMIQDYQEDILGHPLEQEGLVFRRTQWAIGNFLRGWQMDVPRGHRLGADPLVFLDGVRPQIRQKLTEEILDLEGVKFQLALNIHLRKIRPDGGEEYTNSIFRYKQQALLQAVEIGKALDESFPHILKILEKWTQHGSGWTVDYISTLLLDIAKYQPLRGSSYIPLPKAVKNKKAVVNVKNKGDRCIVWTILAAIFKVAKDPQRPSKYPQDHGFDFTGIDYPTPISQISRIEKQNPLAINVFGWDNAHACVIIHRLSDAARARTTVNMLLIEKAGKFHYTWIKDLNRLLYDQSKHQHRKHFCERCLHGYTREDLLEAHKPDCRGIGQTAVRVEMPEAGKNDKLTFQNHHKQFPAPFIIYADFEALTAKIEGPELDPSVSNTQRTQLHETCSYCYVVVRCDGKTETPVEYRGPDAAEHFLRAIQAEGPIIKDVLANPEVMRMTSEDILNHDTATNCHICEKPFACAGDSVRDHCHITGKYRGAAHNACNLKLRLNPKTTTIPVVFHNLRGYDSHLLMQAISRVEGKVSCIPNNTEKYISFSLGQLRFIDSAQFLLTSLDKLVSANPPETFQITARYEPNQQRRELLLRKGVYPYEHMDSWERFADTQLPPKASFYSKLTGEHISDKDYAHAQHVWEVFGCQNMGEYCDLYCRTDVLLLADVFETFRKTCMGQYSLDPAHYYTSPGLSWDALLKKTGVELELLTDYDQHLFIEKGLRGGISMVSKRYARANNPKVEGYNSSKPNTHILYLDANNLYGWAMSQPLPTGGFQWVDDCDRLTETITEHPADSHEGYILEVDLEYPEELHNVHNAYPLAPERMVVKKEWMSEYQHELLDVGVASSEVEKLVPNLYNKNSYVLHYRNLQLYLSLGMRLTKVHRALRFQQSRWMEPYIRLNTELRKKATSGFEKDLFKLMNNSVFGKTMENLRKRVDVKLVRAGEDDRLRRLIASPSYARANIFDDDLAAIQMHKSRLMLNRPVYVGMSVLDLSKHLMYDFYYNQLKKQYGEHCQLLYTDTDSLLLEIQTEDVYKDMGASAGLYDTSDYPKDHPQYSEENKKVVGKMKDECAGRIIAEYVGLRPKMYSILEADGRNIKKAKGVKKSVVRKNIYHRQYREALLDKKTYRHGMDVLRSEHHIIFGQHLNKISLSPFDSKRWIAEDGVETLAYGHEEIAARDAAVMDAFIDKLVGGD